MLTRDDLIDIIVAGLARAEQAVAVPPAGFDPLGPKGRLFLSEHDVKKRLTPGGLRLTIPLRAILSPLVADWLTLGGIQVVRE